MRLGVFAATSRAWRMALTRDCNLGLPKLVPPQNHIVYWLKSHEAGRSQAVKELREYFNLPLPDPRLKRLRRIWNQHRTDPKTLLEALQIFARDNPVLQVERPAIEELGEEDLKVVCYMALV